MIIENTSRENKVIEKASFKHHYLISIGHQSLETSSHKRHGKGDDQEENSPDYKEGQMN